MAPLNARERKHVYMHSTIFDEGGPSSSSVYAPSRQHELYGGMHPTLGKHKAPPPQMDLPSAADIRQTQNAGSGVVMNSGAPGYGNPAGYPGGDLVVVTAGQRKCDSIPKECWNTSVQVDWKDPRNAMRRGKDQEAMSAQNKKLHDLSSEVFDTQRRTQASTTNAKQELRAHTAESLRMDSALEKKTQGDLREAQGDHKGRHNQNLATSGHNTMSVGDAGPTPPAIPQEDPATMHRRRGEKNYSDLFGTQMGARAPPAAREELHGTAGCSFLDTRGEIAHRNTTKWKNDEAQGPGVHANRKEAELDSTLFGFERPKVDRVHANTRDDRACWDTRDLMAPGSEVARRRRMQAFDDGDHGARHRKQEELSGGQFRDGLGQGPQTERPPEPTVGRRNVQRPDPVTAKQTKQAFLQSSIFS